MPDLFSYIIPAGLMLGGLVFFHELGHFLAAKWCGVKVLRFAIGIGPPFLSFRHGETEYALCWFLPLGGYVKILGMAGGEEVPPEDAHRTFGSKPLASRLAIILGGPAANLVLPVAVYFLLFTQPTTQYAAKIGFVIPGSPAAAAGLAPGDRIVAINGAPIAVYHELQDLVSQNPGRQILLTVERQGRRVDLPITPQSHARKDLIGDTERIGRIGIMNVEPAADIAVREGSLAAQAGAASFDRVTHINGAPVPSFNRLAPMIAEAQTTAIHLSLMRPTTWDDGLDTVTARAPATAILPPLPPGADPARPETLLAAYGLAETSLAIAHVKPGSSADHAGLRTGDRITAVDGTPVFVWQNLESILTGELDKPHTYLVERGASAVSLAFTLEKVEYKDDFKQNAVRHELGWARFQDFLPPEQVTFQYTVPQAFTAAVRETGDKISLTFRGLAKLVTREVPLDTLGGPILIADIAKRSADNGFSAFLNTFAIISINLGLFNLIPVPNVLDGGHFAVMAIEAIKRRPLAPRTREILTIAGVAMIAMLMLIAFKNDIVRYLLS